MARREAAAEAIVAASRIRRRRTRLNRLAPTLRSAREGLPQSEAEEDGEAVRKGEVEEGRAKERSKRRLLLRLRDRRRCLRHRGSCAITRELDEMLLSCFLSPVSSPSGSVSLCRQSLVALKDLSPRSSHPDSAPELS